MANAITRAGNNKIGTCPHGLPLGACPICNGMGGGGGSVKRDSKPREMSWNECYAVGQMLKAQKLARQQTQQMFAAQDMRFHLEKLQTQITALKIAAMNNLPRPVAKAIAVLADVMLTPAVRVLQAVSNVVQNLTSAVTKAMDNLKQKVAEIMDKLTAMFGEAKAAFQKKIEEKFKDLKKKIFNLFGLAEADNEEDEELQKIEEKKRLFELNTAKEALFELLENPDIYPEDEESESEEL